MTGDRGYSVIELLVAAAIMLGVLAAVTEVLHDGVLRAPVLEEATDLQQRARVAIDLLASELRKAGAGDDSGALSTHVPAVLPRHAAAGPAVAVPSVLTVRYAPDNAAVARLGAPFLQGDTALVLEAGGLCAANVAACGFTAGTTGVVFDGTGRADTFAVTGVGAGVLSISDHLAARASAYGAGATVLQIVEITFALDAGARTLTRDENGTALPVVDNVLDLRFEYLGVSGRMTEPRPPAGVANCLYDADGAYLHGGVVTDTDVRPIPVTEFVNGPFCGVGRLTYDLDLLRVRAVRIAARFDTPNESLRGTDGQLFARPGQARTSRVIPDIAATFTVNVRNHGR